MTPTVPQAPPKITPVNPLPIPRIGDWCTFDGVKRGRVVSTDPTTTCIADGEAIHWVATHTVLVERRAG